MKYFCLIITILIIFTTNSTAVFEMKFSYQSRYILGADVHVVHINLDKVKRVFIHTPRKGPGASEYFSDIVKRYNKESVIVNAAYFSKTNFRVVGNLLNSYRLINQAPKNHAGTTISFDYKNRVSIERNLFFTVHYTINNDEKWWEKPDYNKLHGINTPINPLLSKDSFKIYNYYYQGGFVQLMGGKAAIIENGEITKKIDSVNKVKIPPQGHVLVAIGKSQEKIDNLNVGDKIRIEYRNDNDKKWKRIVKTAVGAGPKILDNYQVDIHFSEEGFRDADILADKKRVIIAEVNSNKIIIALIRTPVSLYSAALIVKKLGAKNAINFDGGGSSSLSYKGEIKVNTNRKLTNVLVFN